MCSLLAFMANTHSFNAMNAAFPPLRITTKGEGCLRITEQIRTQPSGVKDVLRQHISMQYETCVFQLTKYVHDK